MEVAQQSARARKRLGALLADDRPDARTFLARLRRLRDEEGIEAFATALHRMAHLRIPEVQAERLIEELLEHRSEITRRLGRDPGLRVAAIDYLANVKKLLSNPTIVERAQLERTERSAITDSLTKLYNRRHFARTLALEIRRSHRYSLQLSVAMFDLDDFKPLNDRLGHPFGDLVLQRVGAVLRRAVREADVPCRYGGEEFAVILPETDRLGAYALAERVRDKVSRGFLRDPVQGHSLAVSVSGGIASYPDDGAGAEELVARADEALYLSKTRGKNRISLYHAERRRAVRYPAKSTVKIALACAGQSDTRPVSAIDLSISGVLLAAATPLAPGTEVSLRFEGRDATGRPQAWLHAGRVVRAEPGRSQGKTQAVAVAFDEPLPDECLTQQVRRTKPLRLVQRARA